MKIAASLFAATSVALSATVIAFPALYKRGADRPKVFACFAKAIASGHWSDECVAAAAADVGIVQRIAVEDLDIDFTLSDPATLGLASSSLSAKLLAVPGIQWMMKESAQRCVLADNGIPVAVFDNPSNPVIMEGQLVSLSLPKVHLRIIPGQESNFVAMMASLITQPEHTLTLSGFADATFSTMNLPLTPASFKVAGLGFESPITLKGCHNFPDTPFLKQISFTSDPATGTYTLASLVNIINPSQLVLTMGDVTYQLFDKNDKVVGTSLFKDVYLQMGDNEFTMITTITDKDVYEALIKEGSTLTLRGFDGSSTNPILREALKSVELEVVFPKLSPAV